MSVGKLTDTVYIYGPASVVISDTLTLSVLTSTKVDTRGPVLKSTKVDI